jgi:hypothetical protein
MHVFFTRHVDTTKEDDRSLVPKVCCCFRKVVELFLFLEARKQANKGSTDHVGEDNWCGVGDDEAVHVRDVFVCHVDTRARVGEGVRASPSA